MNFMTPRGAEFVIAYFCKACKDLYTIGTFFMGAKANNTSSEKSQSQTFSEND